MLTAVILASCVQSPNGYLDYVKAAELVSTDAFTQIYSSGQPVPLNDGQLTYEVTGAMTFSVSSKGNDKTGALHFRIRPEG